ncbi:hypothetical protein [Flavobacterium reichenbachii]|uniref:Lipoprotein n=1 Tax=Flavobacterium reichenbachii TaxID=362418 RepID=A0A085ZNJ1_9FLAO|nr:hypothetical protein [Flavobacterium reichenbachii]KFF06005.1 hypothetical protein IW19_10930 [Flavobacterium reichenbachii]OXB14769.1 hypothetical protein B0A68_12005 [Flavobacterium reichenbachii]
MLKIKKSILAFIIATAGFFSCKQSSNSKKDIIETKVSDSIKNINNKNTFNDKDIYTKYKYADSAGKNILIKNGFPRGGLKYTDKNGDQYSYAVFWTQITNETDNPIELTMDFPLNAYEVPSLPDKYYKILIPNDTMTLEKFPLFLYGLTNLESYLDNNIHKSASLNRTINSRESNGFYIVILCLTEGAHGTMRTELSVKGKNLFYEIKVDGSRNNGKSSNKKINCGSINLKN